MLIGRVLIFTSSLLVFIVILFYFESPPSLSLARSLSLSICLFCNHTLWWFNLNLTNNGPYSQHVVG